LWLHSLKVAQLLRSAACLHTNQSRSYLNHLVLLLLSSVLMYGPNKDKGSIVPMDATRACRDSISTAALIRNPTPDGGDERSTSWPSLCVPGDRTRHSLARTLCGHRARPLVFLYLLNTSLDKSGSATASCAT